MLIDVMAINDYALQNAMYAMQTTSYRTLGISPFVADLLTSRNKQQELIVDNNSWRETINEGALIVILVPVIWDNGCWRLQLIRPNLEPKWKGRIMVWNECKATVSLPFREQLTCLTALTYGMSGHFCGHRGQPVEPCYWEVRSTCTMLTWSTWQFVKWYLWLLSLLPGIRNTQLASLLVIGREGSAGAR